MQRFIELVDQDNFTQAIKQIPQNYDKNALNIYYISRVYMELQQYDESLKFIRSYPQLYDTIILFRIGNIYEKQQLQTQAQKYYNLCINKNAHTCLDFICQGDAYYYLEQFDKSLQQYRIALEKDPQNIYALNSMGLYCFKHENNYTMAIEYFNNAIIINKTYYQAILKKGLALLKQQQCQEAIICFDRLIEISPDQVDGYLAKSQGLHKLQKYEEAMKILEQLQVRYPRHPKTLRLYAQNHYYQQNYQAALNTINETIQIDPKYVDAYNDRGNYFKSLNQYENALQDYDTVIKLTPNKPSPFYNKGLCLLLQQQSDQAINLIKKAIILNPGNPLYHIQLAKAYNQINKNDLALHQLQQTQDSLSKNLSRYSLSHKNIKFIEKQISILQPLFESQKEIEEIIEDVTPQIRQRYSMIQTRQSMIIIEQPQNEIEQEEQIKNINYYQKELEKFKKQVMGQLLKQQKEINNLKLDSKQGKQEFQILKSDVYEIQSVFHDQILIKKELKQFEQDLDGQKYLQFYKGFYWTLSNYINIYFQLASGLIQINYDKLIETKQEQIEQTAIQLTQFGQSLTDGIPFVGTTLSIIEKGLQYLLNNQLSTKFEERKTAITEIVSIKCNAKDELETVIAKASIKVTKFRKNELLNIDESLKQKDSNLTNYLNKYLGNLQQSQQIKKYQQHFLYGMNEAIQVLAYFYKNYQKICDSQQTLDQEIMQIYQLDQLVEKDQGIEAKNKQRKSQSRCNQQ